MWRASLKNSRGHSINEETHSEDNITQVTFLEDSFVQENIGRYREDDFCAQRLHFAVEFKSKKIDE